MDLDSIRNKISSIDQDLVKILNERAELSVIVGKTKKKSSDPSSSPSIYVPEQEKAVFNRVIGLNTGPLPNEAITSIYREIMSASISLQENIQIGYLGPSGTFGHLAAKEKFGDSVSYIPCKTIKDVFSAVEKNQVDYGLVPIENSIFGCVVQTLDSFNSLATSKSIIVISEVYLPLQQTLLANCKLDKIKKIYSHPMAFGQAQEWLSNKLPNAQQIETNSTALGAQIASTEPYSAAIANSLCGAMYGLEILEQDISSQAGNTTRFFVISQEKKKPASKNPNKMLAMFTVDHRKAGALCLALEVFNRKNINLTAINSRPALGFIADSSVSKNWHYMFFVEAIISDTNPNEIIDSVINELNSHCLYVKLLGMYPNSL
ncbi:hypothetical protein BB558_002516 [Smittium angustum]|uniref:Bifunctional chorismate mutase/prephenate dehydratase n=1 Tax=Smittium angustum TaxID=133377 RepID=A0A2U1J8P2_SMIAN|nr:hypothetical protein BB558_002516 [Smittium angustum]